MTESSNNPYSGLWEPTQLQKMIYGPNSVQKHLNSCLPTPKSKAFIITGTSLFTKTPLIKQVEELLTPSKHAGTFSKIGEHSPITQIYEATRKVQEDADIDTIISIGGGSPIDSAKAISYRIYEKTGKFLYHISIPTTLSAAECTYFAGNTGEDGMKIIVRDPGIAISVIIYDALYCLHTPPTLFLSTGIRALDHAVELLYNPTSTEAPSKPLYLSAIRDLFEYLPKYRQDPKHIDVITKCQLAAFSSLWPLGRNVIGGLGLSHSLGYALGSPYGIPHGFTSCLTLGKVVCLKAGDPRDAARIARILPFVGEANSRDDRRDAERVGEKIVGLVERLGLKRRLGDWKVGEDQVGRIVHLGTGGLVEGEFYERIAELVRSLY